MSPRKLIDTEMEQTDEAAKSSSYRARQANSDTAKRRSVMSSVFSAKNPATGQSWFETPSAEYQAWEKRGLDNELAARKTQGDQDIAYTDTIITKLRPKANDEANRALGIELATRLPYSSFEENLRSMRQAGINATNMTNSISGAYSNSVSRLNPVSMSL